MALKLIFSIAAAFIALKVTSGDWVHDLYTLLSDVNSETNQAIYRLRNYDNFFLKALLTVQATDDDVARIYYQNSYQSNSQPNITKLETCLNASASEIRRFKEDGTENITAFQNGHDVTLSASILASLKRRADFQRDWTAAYYRRCIESQSVEVCNQNVQLIVKFVVDLLENELREFSETHDFAKVAQDAENLYLSLNKTRAGVIETVLDCAEGH